MLRLKLFIVFLLILFTHSCGTPSSSKSNVNNEKSITLTVDAGSDKIVKINKTLILEGKGSSSDGSELLYTWRKNNIVLSTSAILNYIPRVLGVDILMLSVKHKSGEVLSDAIKITVLENKYNVNVTPISSEMIGVYLNSINKARAKTQNCGKEGMFLATYPLKWNEKLYASSYEHSYDMVYSKTFSHYGSGTSSDWTGMALGKKSILSERIESYGYDWSFIGENIGAGTLMDSADEMVKGWLASDGHCANLMNSDFKEVGMAMIKKENAKYTHYWTQDFGKGR
jgi:uncharacterized protein YkwD